MCCVNVTFRSWLALAMLALALAVAGSASARELTDDEFIASLGDEGPGASVDRKRLAKIFFSLAATLDGGKSSVQLLQGRILVPEASQQAVSSLLKARFEDYARSLTRFKGSVSELLDQPDSMLVFYKVLQDGQRSCWHFDLYNRLIETYGSSSTDLITILSSREACGRFRTAAFQPRVQAIVMDALVNQVYQRAEISELKEELRDLEQLLADLQEIDQAD